MNADDILDVRTLAPVIGLPVDVGNLNQIANKVFGISKRFPNSGAYICVANVHMLTIGRQNSKFKDLLSRATLVIPDGMPLVWTQKLKGFREAERVSGPDLMLHLCSRASSENASIFLLGSNNATLDLLSKNLLHQFPKLSIAGTHAPGTLLDEPELDMQVVKKINDSGASILFVGLGCPKQEYWCANHAPHLKAIAIGVGAAFDFHAGTKKRPSQIIQKLGFEWLYRLVSEPRRLWKRYLISNCIFVCLSLLEFLQTTDK